jgi:predicted secreted Zn-dependent protease
MSRIPGPEECPNGFHRRYEISKTTGEPVEDNAEYMVLRLDWGGDDKEHIRACRIAAAAYAMAIEHHLPELSKDLLERYTPIPKNAEDWDK